MPEYRENSYGKRPLWQWVVIYLVIAAVVYGAIYYFVFAKKGGYGSGGNNATQYNAPSGTSSATTPAVQPSLGY